MDALNVAKSVFIKQSIEWVEMITGYETPNRYQVYFRNPGDTNYTMLFNCKEMSECCERNYCSGDSRPFTMNIKHMVNYNPDNDYTSNVFAVMNKPYKCTCFCLARPEMFGYYSSLEGSSFGQILQPYSYCDPVFHVKNKNGKIIYSITTDCCKCGFCCRGGCGMFEPISFHIFEGESCDSKQVNLAKGVIIKHSMGVQSLLSDADNFEVFFPETASAEDKLTLIGATLMIDYMFFEENPNQR